MDLPKKKIEIESRNTTGSNSGNTGLKKAVIQVVGSLEVDILDIIYEWLGYDVGCF